jgi:rod shape-determining protein MreC
MAVVTPEGIVGKVTAVYPLVSQVLLVTDPTFKVGVESQKGHVHGILNCGSGKCAVEQVQNEDRVESGEWFFTSGEDRIFPRGFPVGTVVSSKPGQGMRDVALNLSGAPGGVEQVLVVLQGVHQTIPAAPVVQESTSVILPAPPPDSSDATQAPRPQTEADKIVQHYNELGKAQNHEFGAYGSNLPNFNAKTNANGTPAQAAPNGNSPEKAAQPQIRPNTPGLLGARPGSNLPAVSPPQQMSQPKPEGPTLLGSPKRKQPPSDAPKVQPGDE